MGLRSRSPAQENGAAEDDSGRCIDTRSILAHKYQLPADGRSSKRCSVLGGRLCIGACIQISVEWRVWVASQRSIGLRVQPFSVGGSAQCLKAQPLRAPDGTARSREARGRRVLVIDHTTWTPCLLPSCILTSMATRCALVALLGGVLTPAAPTCSYM